MLVRTVPIAIAALGLVAVAPIAVAQTTTTTTPPSSTTTAPPVAGTEPGFTGMSGTTDAGGGDTSTGTGKSKQTATGGNPGGPAGRN